MMTPNATSARRRTALSWRPWALAAAVVAVIAAAWLWHSDAVGPRAARRNTSGSTPAMNMPGMNASSASTSAASTGSTVQLTADQLRQFGVTFGTVAVRTLENEARTVGVVTIDSARLTQVTPRFGGYVERLYANTAGRSIERGQPLLDVYSPELVAAQQDLLVASNLERSIRATDVPGVATTGRTDLVSAARQRLALWGISDAQINAILQSGLPRRTLTLYAPASGVVVEKNVVQGQAIQPGQMLYTVANLATVWVDAELRETDAGSIRVNATAHVDVAALPGRTFAGRVTYVYPTLDPSARTVRARISLANTGGALRPGMYATVTLASPSSAALTVPSSAIIRTGERNLVFVDAGGGRLQPLEITAGRVAGDLTEVVSGLSPGQRVVTSAQFLLDAESNLGEVMRSMIGQGNMSSSGGGASMNMNMSRPLSAPMTEKGADMRGMSGKSTPAAPLAPSHAPPRR